MKVRRQTPFDANTENAMDIHTGSCNDTFAIRRAYKEI
jgi:hypothetical protein